MKKHNSNLHIKLLNLKLTKDFCCSQEIINLLQCHKLIYCYQISEIINKTYNHHYKKSDK
jgi:hypothetical protein